MRPAALRELQSKLDDLSTHQLKDLSSRLFHSIEGKGLFGISQLELFLTGRCNLNCSYCFEANKNPDSVLDVEYGKKAIDWFLNQDTLLDLQKRIFFFGGEPLLEMDRLAQLIRHARRREPLHAHLSIGLTTNATAVNASFIKLFKENSIKVLVSLDLNESAHNKYRRTTASEDTHALVLANLAELVRNGVETSVRPTVCPSTVSGITEYVRSCHDMGVRSIHFGFADNLVWSREDLHDLGEDLKEAVVLYRGFKRSGANFRISLFDGLEKRNQGKRNCSAGRARVAVTPSGDIYGCSRCFVANGNQGIHRLGTVDDFVINHEPVQELCNCADKLLVRCSKCRIASFCSGSCPGSNHDKNNSSQVPNAVYCAIQRVLYDVKNELDRTATPGTPHFGSRTSEGGRPARTLPILAS